MQKVNKGFSRIDKVLAKSAKEYNLEQPLNKYRAIKVWDEVAAGFVEEAVSQTKAIDFNKGVLVVACLSKEVASKIKLLAKNIIAALNELLGSRLVYAISIEL